MRETVPAVRGARGRCRASWLKGMTGTLPPAASDAVPAAAAHEAPDRGGLSVPFADTPRVYATSRDEHPRPQRRGGAMSVQLRLIAFAAVAVLAFATAALVEHTRRMHVIVVRRDMTGFQHVHPTQAADGTWSVPVTLRDAGT